jgi:transcriptional regulator with XRE-family HTH domain
MVISRIERGERRLDLEVLERLAIVFGVYLAVSLGRDPTEDVADAGHLAMQELVLRRGRANGLTRQFELATKPAEAWRSADVVLGSDPQHTLVDIECWNTIGDVGAATRSSSRKQVDLEQVAVGRWGEDAIARLVWVVRDSAKNRELISRYPEVFATRFPGSSRAWVRALTRGGPIPEEPGLLWCDVRRGRLYEWRRDIVRTEMWSTVAA